MATTSNRMGSTNVDGVLRCTTFYPPNECIPNAAIQTGAAIDSSKLEQTYRKTYFKAGTAASETVPIHLVNGATARNLYVRAGSIAIAVGSATVVIDLKKNGTTVLSGTTTLDSSNTARTAVELGVTTTTAVAGDLYELVITATASGGTIPTGLFVEFEIDEAYTT